LVLVGAGDPMWRGGLSGPQSIYLHRDRPLVDDDGTSPILHELTHVFMGAKAGPGGDWVVEGIAEYYAIEVLYRSGGMSTEERVATHRQLRRKGRRVDELEVDRAKSRVTARAVAVLDRLDQRMRDLTEDRANLDLVLRRLIRLDEPITTELFKAVVEEVVGQPMDAFFETYVVQAQSP
jgi:predicted metalloprotease with PDZ domain